MRYVASRRRTRGAVVITTCLMLLFLLGFMAFALDFSRLFIVKSELQTAMDSCALSAAQELDGLPNALADARSAGAAAANLNRVNLQSATWDAKTKVTDADISFLDNSYTATSSDAAAVYVECAHTQPAVRLWLMRAMAAFSGNTGLYPATQDVFARAVAKRGSAQTSCPTPVAVKPPAGGTKANNYGFAKGQWALIYNNSHGTGEFGWYNLDGSTNANETKYEMTTEICNTVVGQTLGTPGAQTAVDVPWNERFGIYKNGDGPSQHRPDYSGYSYTPFNWPRDSNCPGTLPCSAFKDFNNFYSSRGLSKPAGAGATADFFVNKRAAFASLDNTGTNLKDGSLITFGNQNTLNSFKTLATPGSAGEHHQYGADKRISTVPVLDSGNKIVDYLCIFMLAPMSGPTDNNYIEILGLAGAADSPCTTNGLPGGVAGPLVPVLVR